MQRYKRLAKKNLEEAKRIAKSFEEYVGEGKKAALKLAGENKGARKIKK